MAIKIAVPQERVARVGQRHQVIIPRDLLEALNLRAGDLVAFSKQANGVLMKPKRVAGKVADPDDVLTPAEAKKVRRGMKQIQEGRFTLLRGVKDELGR